MDDGRRPRHDGLGERFIRDLQVGLVLKRRHPQRVAVVAEAILRPAVFRKLRAKFDRQAEQVLHRPLVLAAGQPAEVRGLVFRERGPAALLSEPGRHQLAVFFLESRFLRGRHVAEIEPIEHVAPVVAVLAFDEIGIELVDPQVALRLFRRRDNRSNASERAA